MRHIDSISKHLAILLQVFVALMFAFLFICCLLAKNTLFQLYGLILKDQKILLIMAAKRADQTRHNKMAEKAHKRWEVERNQQIRTAEEQELQRWHSLAQQRQKQEQQKVGPLAVPLV